MSVPSFRHRVPVALISLFMLGIVFVPTAQAATIVVVTPTNMQGWAFFDDNGNGGTGVMVSGPAMPPRGTGSAELAVSSLSQGYALGTGAYAGTALADITSLSYWSYQPGPTLAIALQFDIKYRPADTSYDGRLVYEPYQNGTVTVGSGWQQWSPLSGIWWASHTGATNGSNGLCPISSPCAWSTILADFPNATISGALLFKAGGGWSSFSGNVDALTVGVSGSDTTYDFEPTPQCTTDCYVSTSGSDANGGTSFSDAKATIQAAVNQVSSGGTVHVAAGTYAENVDVTTPVTIEGAGQGATFVEPAVSNAIPAGCGEYTALCAGASSVFLIGADNVRITGLTVEGINASLGAGIAARNGIITDFNTVAASNNLTVDYVTVQDIYLRGIEVRGTGFDLSDDTVTNVNGDVNASVAMFNTVGSGTFSHNTVSVTPDAINSNHSSGTQVLDNVISDAGSGIHTDNAGDGVGVADLISGNTISDCVAESAPSSVGIWVFVPYLAPTVTDNTITNCSIGLGAFGGAENGATVTPLFSGNYVDGAGLAGSIGAWIWTGAFGFGNSNVAAYLEGNTLVDNATGVQVDGSPDSYAGATSSTATADVTLHYNVIAGNSAAGVATVQSTTPVDATDNWWGCSGGPADTSHCNGVSGNVNASPWLVDTLSVSPSLVAAGTTTSATVTADLTHDSTPGTAPGTVPDGTPVNFSLYSSSNVLQQTTSGTTSGGVASATFTGLGSLPSDVYEACAQVPTTYGALECTPYVVYDASAGFVTGGGWIASPAGAYAADPTLTGKATFGFVSKYQKGATVPSGNTHFVFQTGNLDFSSTSYQWLVVNQGGTNAQFKGTGTINGAGSYTFMIWATQGSPSTFRIQITDNNNNGATVYDNGPNETIGGGSIIVHK